MFIVLSCVSDKAYMIGSHMVIGYPLILGVNGITEPQPQFWAYFWVFLLKIKLSEHHSKLTNQSEPEAKWNKCKPLLPQVYFYIYQH